MIPDWLTMQRFLHFTLTLQKLNSIFLYTQTDAEQTLCCFPIEFDIIFICFRFINSTFFLPCVQMERGCHGLERVTVAKFPTKKYSDKFFAAAENSQYVHISVSDFLIQPVYDVN